MKNGQTAVDTVKAIHCHLNEAIFVDFIVINEIYFPTKILIKN